MSDTHVTGIKLPPFEKPSWMGDCEHDLLQASPPIVGPQVTSHQFQKVATNGKSCLRLYNFELLKPTASKVKPKDESKKSKACKVKKGKGKASFRRGSKAKKKVKAVPRPGLEEAGAAPAEVPPAPVPVATDGFNKDCSGDVVGLSS